MAAAAAIRQNNEDAYETANEDDQQDKIEIDLDILKLQPQKKIIRKKKVINQVLQNNEPKKFTIKDIEYLEYKTKLFGKLEPDRTDKYCDFYLCNDIQQIKYFVENIKEYALNTKICEEHVSSIAKKIYTAKELYFVNPIAIIEHINASADTPRDLIELVDGHHRLKCIKQLFNRYQYEEISFTFWIQVYKSNKTLDTNELFKKYNTCKPFSINLGLNDLIILIIDKLNMQFNIGKFELIKNTIQRANRPSIGKKEFAEKLTSRLESQTRTTNEGENNYDYNTVDIDKIINKFLNYNKTLQTENIDWFNQKDFIKDSSKISENIYKKAKDNKCMLGLLPLDEIISQCISL